MVDSITIGVGTPEQGWGPALDWVREHELDPTRVRTITVDPDTLDAEVVCIKYRNGKIHVEGDDIVTFTVPFTVPFKAKSLPPQRQPISQGDDA